MLAQKVSGTSAGLWLLVPELLRLGIWDILKTWTGANDKALEPRIALQMINESALCVNRVRKQNSLGHQGFQLVNGMGRLVTDQQAHVLMDHHTMEQTRQMLVNLGLQRQLSGHYQGGLIAIDPHRMLSSSKRVMAKKRKDSEAPSKKMLQTFFAVSAQTGQPIMSTMASTGVPTSQATLSLLHSISSIVKSEALLMADKEHFTYTLFKETQRQENLNLLTPVLNTSRVQRHIRTLTYEPLWAGFALAETSFKFIGYPEAFRLIAQRTGERKEDFTYNAFITTSGINAKALVCDHYDKRWSVEEFFRFENEMGLYRASTLNLNIRYARLAFSMMAQAATYQLRNKLTTKYRNWNAGHLANEILAWTDGDVRVKDDTIIVTIYNPHKHIDTSKYINISEVLAKEGVNPKIPWLYDFKLDFRFK
ncbi:MAG: hypothetical protein K9I74_05725 [Bacteroidales bacterium]|nr:hypothetical protein [Bacteroidales bacterium]